MGLSGSARKRLGDYLETGKIAVRGMVQKNAQPKRARGRAPEGSGGSGPDLRRARRTAGGTGRLAGLESVGQIREDLALVYNYARGHIGRPAVLLVFCPRIYGKQVEGNADLYLIIIGDVFIGDLCL